jgi:hypothetical protein
MREICTTNETTTTTTTTTTVIATTTAYRHKRCRSINGKTRLFETDSGK